MTQIKIRIAALFNDERGVTAMEYGMIAAATIVAIASFMTTISAKLSSIFSIISASV